MQMTFAAAMLAYFGKRPGTGLKDFQDELKALTAADRAFFESALPSVGYEVVAKAA